MTMTLQNTFLAVLLLTSSSCTNLAHDSPTAFEWLIGDWVTEDGTITEHWWAVSKETYEGKGVTTSKNKVSTESLRLLFMDNNIFFVAKVSHNDLPVAFLLTAESTPEHSVFVNPTHDFPKRIVYDRDGDNRMSVTVSDGGNKGFQLHFSRYQPPDTH